MDAKNEEGENSSPLKETVRIQFVHRRDIGIARASSHSSPLALCAFHRRQENTFLPYIHSRHWRPLCTASARQSVFGRRVSLHHSHSLLLSPLSSPSRIQRRLSLSPRYNATPSNPIHRCFSHPHIALLDQSTTSYWVRAPHCVSRESHICS